MSFHKHYNWYTISKHWAKQSYVLKWGVKFYKPCERSFHRSPNNLIITRKLILCIKRKDKYKQAVCVMFMFGKHFKTQQKKISLHKKNLNSLNKIKSNSSAVIATKTQVVAIHDSCMQRRWEMGVDSYSIKSHVMMFHVQQCFKHRHNLYLPMQNRRKWRKTNQNIFKITLVSQTFRQTEEFASFVKNSTFHLLLTVLFSCSGCRTLGDGQECALDRSPLDHRWKTHADMWRICKLHTEMPCLEIFDVRWRR